MVLPSECWVELLDSANIADEFKAVTVVAKGKAPDLKNDGSG